MLPSVRPPRVRHNTFPLIPTASTFVPSVQLLDFESRCPLIRHASLICDFCSLGQWFAIDFLQNLPRDKPLVFRLEVPAAGPSEVFHLLVLRHAGRTSEKTPSRRMVPKATSKTSPKVRKPLGRESARSVQACSFIPFLFARSPKGEMV